MINYPLGKNQKTMLAMMVEHQSYHRGCGWLFESRTMTERVLDSLVRQGLAERSFPEGVKTWRLTEAGEKAARGERW